MAKKIDNDKDKDIIEPKKAAGRKKGALKPVKVPQNAMIGRIEAIKLLEMAVSSFTIFADNIDKDVPGTRIRKAGVKEVYFDIAILKVAPEYTRACKVIPDDELPPLALERAEIFRHERERRIDPETLKKRRGQNKKNIAIQYEPAATIEAIEEAAEQQKEALMRPTEGIEIQQKEERTEIEVMQDLKSGALRVCAEITMTGMTLEQVCEKNGLLPLDFMRLCAVDEEINAAWQSAHNIWRRIYAMTLERKIFERLGDAVAAPVREKEERTYKHTRVGIDSDGNIIYATELVASKIVKEPNNDIQAVVAAKKLLDEIKFLESNKEALQNSLYESMTIDELVELEKKLNGETKEGSDARH